jgi:hypothetical protein
VDELLLGDTLRRSERDDAQPRLRERASLVDADCVHRGQRLDRVQLLCEGSRAGHSERRRRIGDGREQHEALGNEGDHAGDRSVDRVPEPDVLLPERDDEHGAERHHHGQQRVQQPVDRELERGARMAELSGGALDAAGVAFLSHRRHFERSCAFHDKRAGPGLLPGLSGDCGRLARQDRLRVKLHTPRAFSDRERVVRITRCRLLLCSCRPG